MRQVGIQSAVEVVRESGPAGTHRLKSVSIAGGFLDGGDECDLTSHHDRPFRLQCFISSVDQDRLFLLLFLLYYGSSLLKYYPY